MLIPADRHDEEPMILSKIRKGERVDHFETLRQRKDGSLIPISLTISPVRAADGTIIGASKIARDITEHTQAQEQQQLLLREDRKSVVSGKSVSGRVDTGGRGIRQKKKKQKTIII